MLFRISKFNISHNLRFLLFTILPSILRNTRYPIDFVTSFRMSSGRLLHYVYKVPKRTDTVDFYRTLGMTALRHEEFTEGCEAQVSAKR